MGDTADQTDPSPLRRPSSIHNNNPLNYAIDAGLLCGPYPPDDSPESTDLESGGEGSDSDSDTESADIAASLHFLLESVVRMRKEELEMMKRREILRMEAEKSRYEVEVRMIESMAQTQLQIASLLSQTDKRRKRKRSGDAGSTSPNRQPL